MLARGAQNNPSIFRHEGLLPVKEVAIEYLRLVRAMHIIMLKFSLLFRLLKLIWPIKIPNSRFLLCGQI
jgi:hypothetical protein